MVKIGDIHAFSTVICIILTKETAAKIWNRFSDIYVFYYFFLIEITFMHLYGFN